MKGILTKQNNKTAHIITNQYKYDKQYKTNSIGVTKLLMADKDFKCIRNSICFRTAILFYYIVNQI